MARYVSRRSTVTVRALKRKPLGTVVVHHWSYGEARFTRVHGGWIYELKDSVWDKPAVLISSTDVANVCNRALGCKENWARIY